jgi:hypothetical protein
MSERLVGVVMLGPVGTCVGFRLRATAALMVGQRFVNLANDLARFLVNDLLVVTVRAAVDDAMKPHPSTCRRLEAVAVPLLDSVAVLAGSLERCEAEHDAGCGRAVWSHRACTGAAFGARRPFADLGVGVIVNSERALAAVDIPAVEVAHDETLPLGCDGVPKGVGLFVTSGWLLGAARVGLHECDEQAHDPVGAGQFVRVVPNLQWNSRDVDLHSVESARCHSEFGCVNKRALNDGLVVPRYPSYAGAATIVGIEFILDVDLLAWVGPLAAVQEKGVDFTPVNMHEHHPVDLVFGHGADHIAAAEIARSA